MKKNGDKFRFRQFSRLHGTFKIVVSLRNYIQQSHT